MPIDLIENFLQSNDLNPTDIKIYLDVYKHGQVFASSIAARTEIDRTTVYSSLKRLLKKGIVIQTKINDVKAYTAVSPEVFADKIDNRIENLHAQKKAAALFAKEMLKLQKHSFEKPKIRIFEGVEAIKSLYEETLARNTEQKAFVNLTTVSEPLKNFLKSHFIKAKLAKNVRSKVLVAENKYSKKYKSLDSASNRETKIISAHPFKLHSEIILFAGSKVAIVDFHKQIYGIVFESETLHKSLENIFDLIWATN